MTQTDHPDHHFAPSQGVSGAPTAIDPVCGMDVALDDRHPRYEYGGQIYAFCCDGCRTAFAAAPQTYLVAGRAT